MSEQLPGKGLFGWLGRQVGHVKRAVKTDPAKAKPAEPVSPTSESPPAPKVLYRDGKVEEAPHPAAPGLKLRRTIIDEVIEEPPPQPAPPPPREPQQGGRGGAP